ncbi:MAG: response regulator [Thermodesulfobacteriota bacterium]|nr:response regulator [Thermodesulfobacteriota bacterium]
MAAQILIVDDELDMLALLAMIITEKTDHKVTTTNNPLEVPELVKTGAYDVLISDLKMPGMDGVELIDEIRKIDEHIPILIITAYGSNESAEEAIHKGAYDYIIKPFRKEQVLIAISRALEWQKMRAELRQLKEKSEAKQ